MCRVVYWITLDSEVLGALQMCVMPGIDTFRVTVLSR